MPYNEPVEKGPRKREGVRGLARLMGGSIVARYREYSYDQTLMLPVKPANQLQPGTCEHTITTLVDHHIDLSVFDEHYRNDDVGAPAIDPAILLTIVLFAYSRGIISSREIARAGEENVVFMALAADTRPATR